MVRHMPCHFGVVHCFLVHSKFVECDRHRFIYVVLRSSDFINKLFRKPKFLHCTRA